MNFTFSSIVVTVAHTNPIDPIIMNAVSTVNLLLLTESIGLFGIVANVVSIVTFSRQGYRDGVNVTLTALAVSDLGILVTHQIYAQIFDPWTDESSFAMLKNHMILFVVYASDYFSRVSGFVTSFAAFERCLCVILPMKVKLVVTQKVAVIVNVSIFVIFLCYILIPYSLMYVNVKYVPSFNRTISYVYFLDIRKSIISHFYFIAALCIPYLTIIMLLTFTLILVTKLKTTSSWRQQVLNPNNREINFISYRDRKVIVMLSTVSSLYVVCLIPHSALNMAMALVDEMKLYGVYFDINTLTFSFTTLLETINCSLTPIIYYRMSSRYREVVHDIFLCKKK